MEPLGKMLLLFALVRSGLAVSNLHYGAKIGKLNTHFHDVKGDVYAVDEKRLFIKNFHYDGKGSDAVFWAGSSTRPDNSGFVVPFDRNSSENLASSYDQDFILHLPDGNQMSDIHWLSVWSRKYAVSFGSVIFPRSLIPPRPVLIGSLNNTREGTSSGDILILDSQTFLIPNFNYDASGKDVYWWISRSLDPNLGGLRLQVENGSDFPLQEHKNKTVIITLPDGRYVFEFHLLSLWSESETENYGSVTIPSDLNVPPSPRSLEAVTNTETDKLNCEMLNDNLGLEVRWLIKGNDIIIHLVGNIEDSEYMAFGFSKDDTETRFDSADAAITWLDEDGKGHVDDYFLEHTEMCLNGHGMCPDDVLDGSRNNFILLNASKFNKTTTIAFKRSLKAEDKLHDQNIYTDGPQAVLWAIGPLQDGNLAGPPKFRTRGNLLLDFGRDPNWNCPPPKDEVLSQDATDTHLFKIHCPSDHLFRAQMGPSINKNITNVWFINGLPTPELTVQRGQEYTFVVEGGMGPSVRNPLYITNSSEGGLYQNLLETIDSHEKFFAGVHHDVPNGLYFPTSEGRLCQWSVSDKDPAHSITTEFADSSSPLVLSCEPGNYATLVWTPDADTPDTIYYQSFTEKHLGGKIRVLDFCEETTPHSFMKNTSDETSRNKGNQLKPELEREDEDRNLEAADIQLEIGKENERPDSLQKEEINKQHKNRSPESYENISDSEKEGSESVSDGGSSINIAPPGENTSEEIKSVDETEISWPLTLDSQHPHDESERSDKMILRHQSTEVKVEHNKIAVGSFEKPLNKQQMQIPQNDPPQTTPRQSTRFKPQFQGGFVPLVLNPVKEKESSKELDLPHFRRPHRPFLFNESIPFHGTFKPGVPDFSGFNISHYSRDESYPLNYVLDNLPMLSASNSLMTRTPFTSMNGLPVELFQRPPMQRPQTFGYKTNLKSHNFGFLQQPQLPNVRLHNSREEDLAEVSSQRVQVALQASMLDKETGHSQMQRMRSPNHKLQNKPKMNNLIHAPPIQRRPDFVVEGEVPLNSPLYKSTQVNRFPERLPIKNSENIENQRIRTVMKPNGVRNTYGIRRPLPMAKTSFNGMGIDNVPRRIPLRGLQIKTNHQVQGPPREILSPFPGTQRDSSFLERPPTHAEIKLRDSVPNISSYNKFHLRPQAVNPTLKVVDNIEKVEIPEGFDMSASKDHEVFPLFLNPKIIQHPAKNSRPQLVSGNNPNTRNLPGLIISSNRPQISPRPTFPLKDETIIKKLPIAMQEIKPHSITTHSSTPQIDLILAEHILNDKIEKQKLELEQSHNIRKSNQTATQLSDTFQHDSDEDAGKSEMHPSEFDLTAMEMQSDSLSDLNIEEQPHLLEKGDEGENEGNNSEKTDIISSQDYEGVPFGARLKSPPNNGSAKPITNTFHRTSSSVLERTTAIPFELADSKDINISAESEWDSSEKEYNKQAVVSDTSIVSESFTDKAIMSSLEADLKKDSSNNKRKFAPLFLDDDALEKHKRRENILPNGSESNIELSSDSSRVAENINLPHISEKAPSHDNGTDYSILNHVLSLIGGPPS